MDLGLRDRVAAVAGSSRGIGRAIALALAQEGASVVVSGRTASTVEDAASEIVAAGYHAIGVVCDVSTPQGAQQLISEAVSRFARLDVLVTNAGGPPAGNFDQLSDEAFQKAFETNFMSAARLVRAALPHLQRSNAARVVNVQSTAVREPIAMLTLTNSIRPSVVGLAKDLANWLGPQQITVNTILVGPTLTDRLKYTIGARARARGVPESDLWDEYLRLVPLGRFGAPGDIAGLVAFLASSRAGWITGTVIPVDGGRIRSAV